MNTSHFSSFSCCVRELNSTINWRGCVSPTTHSLSTRHNWSRLLALSWYGEPMAVRSPNSLGEISTIRLFDRVWGSSFRLTRLYFTKRRPIPIRGWLVEELFLCAKLYPSSYGLPRNLPCQSPPFSLCSSEICEDGFSIGLSPHYGAPLLYHTTVSSWHS